MRKRVKEENVRNIIIISLLLSLGIVSFLISLPYLEAIFGGLILGYLLIPFQKRLVKIIKYKGLAAIIILIVSITIIIAPIVPLFNNLTRETILVYTIAKSKMNTMFSANESCTQGNCLYLTSKSIKKVLVDSGALRVLSNSFNIIAQKLIKASTEIVLSLPSKLLQIFVVLFVSFYVLTDEGFLLKQSMEALHISAENQRKIKESIDDVLQGVVVGFLVVAMAQGAVAAAGFYILGKVLYVKGGIFSSVMLGAPILWGLITMGFALIPFLGAGTVWLPLSLFHTIMGFMDHNPWQRAIGIILFFYGFFIISGIDNLLRPSLISKRAKIHPIVVLVGVLGGLRFLGVAGMILGPVILAFTQRIVEFIIRTHLRSISDSRRGRRRQ